jgi:hypothetical protein
MQAAILQHKTWILVGGAFLLLLFFLFLVDVGALARLLDRIAWGYIGTATFILLIGYLLLAVRLRYILFNKTGWWKTFYANNVAYMLHIALFVPALAARVVSIGSITSASLAQASSATLIERLLEQTMRMAATILAIILFSSNQMDPGISIGGGLVLLVGIFAAILWIVKHPEKVVNRLASLLTGVRGLSQDQISSTASSVIQSLQAVSSARRLGFSLLLSSGAWACFLVFQFLVLAALPLDLPTHQMWLIAAVVLAVMPPSINVMLIVYQVVVTVLLITLNLTDNTTALAYAITLHLIQMICWLILGLWSKRQTGQNLRQLAHNVKSRVAQEGPAKV